MSKTLERLYAWLSTNIHFNAPYEFFCAELDAIRAQLESMKGGDADRSGDSADSSMARDADSPNATPPPVGAAGGEYTIGQYLDLVEPVRMQGNMCIYCPYEHNGFHHQNCRWYAWGRLRDKLQETLIRLSHALAPPPAPILAALNDLEPYQGTEQCVSCDGPLPKHAKGCPRAAWELLRDHLQPKPVAVVNADYEVDSVKVSADARPIVPVDLGEGFRGGLPPISLRKVCTKWEEQVRGIPGQLRDRLLDITADRYRAPGGDWIPINTVHWADDPLGPVIWLRPYARTWMSVQVDAASMLGAEDANAGEPMRNFGRLAQDLGIDVKRSTLARQHDSGKPGDFSDPRTIAYRDAYNAAKSQGEEYRTGLPSEALRMVCGEWEQEKSGDVIEMRGGSAMFARWQKFGNCPDSPASPWFTPVPRTEDREWLLRPLNRTWASVEKEAAALPEKLRKAAYLEFCMPVQPLRIEYQCPANLHNSSWSVVLDPRAHKKADIIKAVSERPQIKVLIKMGIKPELLDARDGTVITDTLTLCSLALTVMDIGEIIGK